MREVFKEEAAFLASHALLLSLVYPGGGQCWDAHAVTQEENHVLGHFGVLCHRLRTLKFPASHVVPIILAWI